MNFFGCGNGASGFNHNHSRIFDLQNGCQGSVVLKGDYCTPGFKATSNLTVPDMEKLNLVTHLESFFCRPKLQNESGVIAF
jgi:hypothetical protein